MPITKTITETNTRTVTLMTLQEYADASLPEEYRQPLKNLGQALLAHGWGPLPEDDDGFIPNCCGNNCECQSFIWSAYAAHCRTCGKFILDVTGPSFGNSSVSFCNPEKVDMETDIAYRWIAGIKKDK